MTGSAWAPQTAQLVSNNVVGNTSGVAPSSDLLGYVVAATGIATTAIGTAEQDVTGASILLTPGRWRIVYNASVTTTTGTTLGADVRTMLCITDSANTHIGKTERFLGIKTPAAASAINYGQVYAETFVTVTTNTTYKLRAVRTDVAGTNSSNVLSSAGNFDTELYAVRM